MTNVDSLALQNLQDIYLSNHSFNDAHSKGNSEWFMFHVIDTDHNYLKTLDIKLSEGGYFQGNNSDKDKIVINQTLVNYLGWEHPIGKTIKRNNKIFTIIGVVKDFSFNSLHYEIKPLLITSVPWECRYPNLWGSFSSKLR